MNYLWSGTLALYQEMVTPDLSADGGMYQEKTPLELV
jgi:hypothetical protein